MRGLLRYDADVIPIAGTLKAVNDDDDRHVLALAGLPVAMGEQPGFRIDLKQPGFGDWDIKSARHERGRNSHRVAMSQQRMGFECGDDELHIETVFHGVGTGKPEPPSSRNPSLYQLTMRRHSQALVPPQFRPHTG